MRDHRPATPGALRIPDPRGAARAFPAERRGRRPGFGDHGRHTHHHVSLGQ
jgi:hypothetical protein